MRARIQASAASAVLVLTISMIAFGGTPGAIATQGQPVIAGDTNTETQSTVFSEDSYSMTCNGRPNVAIVACGGDGADFAADTTGVSAFGNYFGVDGVSDRTGISGRGNITGVSGSGATGVFGYTFQGENGVKGEASANSSGSGVFGLNDGAGNGVTGQVNNPAASGVYGQNDGTGYGTAGRSNTGTGVLGDSESGTGVHANSDRGTALSATAGGGATGIATQAQAGGTALKVTGASQFTGKTKFSRSGIVTIAAGVDSKAVTLGGVSSNSMILVTAQQASSVSVKAAVPSSGSFTIYLTGNAPTGGLKVAYFVLN